MNEKIKCVNCGDNDINWKPNQDSTTECLNCGHDRTTGEKISDEPQGESFKDSSESGLPVAAKVMEVYYLEEDDYDFPHINIAINEDMRREFEEDDDLTPVRCAEEAIQEARREERRETLDKVDDKISQVDRLGKQYGSEMNADMIKNELEELRDELEGGSRDE